ncbi:MAG: hypothetical protein Q9201_006061 [Fulgogasparrea decipioides]
MYALLMVSLAVIGLCSARPAQSDLFQPDSGLLDGPSMGFPARYLPFGAVTPSIRSEISSRPQPFSNFLHIIQPSSDASAVLTPLKVGLGYCFMLQKVQSQQAWPGHIRESIYDDGGAGTGRQKVLLATINLDNSPLRGPNTAVTTSPTVTDGPKPDGSAEDSDNLSMSVAEEKRWIYCFTRVLFSFLHYPAPGKVTDEPLYAPQSEPITYHYTFEGDSHLDFTVYPAGNAEGRHALTWDMVVRSMVSLVTTGARSPSGHMHIEIVKDAGVEIARLKLVIAADH